MNPGDVGAASRSERSSTEKHVISTAARIQKYYDSKGYFANISDEGFGLINGVLEVAIEVGRVGPLTLRGLSGADDRLARRELGRVLSPGSYYNSHELDAALKRLKKHKIVLEEPDVSPGDGWINPRLGGIRLNLMFRKGD